MLHPCFIINNPPRVSSENGFLNSSEEETRGGLHFDRTLTIIQTDPGGWRKLSSPASHGAGQTDLCSGPTSPSQSIGSPVPFPDSTRTTDRIMNSHHKTEKIQPQNNHVGIDVSKLHLDISIAGKKNQRIANTTKGIEQLLKKLADLPSPRVTCEATGGYEHLLVQSMHRARIPVAVAAPGRVRHLAKAEGLIAKTDAIDAELIRRFAEKIPLHLRQELDPQSIRLREITDSRRILNDDITQTKNRLELAQGYKKELLLEQLSQLEILKMRVDRDLQNHLNESEELAKQAARLQELKGVGPILAATILSQLPEIGHVGDKTLACIVGVAPHPKQSGNYRGKSSIRGGRSAVRHVLYMAAVAAARSNPILKAFYQRLRESGKPAKVAIVAVMRKMLSVLNKLLTNPQFSLAN